jgi:hypothetical protein
MLSAEIIVSLHDRRTRDWHQPSIEHSEAASPNSESTAASDQDSPWLTAVTHHHRANFDLWHIEDEARAPGATDSQLAGVKRAIDRINQLRNDLTEELDRTLLGWLEPQDLPNPQADLHSESPGLIIDRLSILALKIYHMREQAERVGATEDHAARSRERLSILEEQRGDLATCLQALWRQTLAGTRRFKLYRQLKMYNDPSLNPVFYRRPAQMPLP